MAIVADIEIYMYFHYAI